MDTETPELAGASASAKFDPIDLHIGRRITQVRLEQFRTFETLGQATGISPSRLAQIEAGAVTADALELERLANALSVKIRYFFERGEPSAPQTQSWVRDVERWFGANLIPYERDFLGLARRMTGDLEAARDVVHDAYAKILAGSVWTTLTHPRAYVMRAVYNLALNRLRKSRVVPMQKLAQVETISYADMSPDAFQALSAHQETRRLMDAIAKLPDRCRKVVMMRKLDELKTSEIASEMGISVSMVEKHLARGLVLLARRLSEDDVPPV